MNFSKYFAAFSILATLTLSAPAWADIPPDDACMESNEGKGCNNASIDGSLPIMSGICQKAMCTRATPDGSMTYECHRCVGEDQGSGGQSNEGGSSGSAGSKSSGGSSTGTAGKSSGAGTTSTAGKPADPPEPDDEDDEGGCSLARTPGGGGAVGTGLLVLGLAVAGMFRRRSTKS